MEVSCSFDTESTSYYENIENGQIIDVPSAKKIPRKVLDRHYRKGALVYAWIFTLNGHCFVGRTVEEFVQLCETVSRKYQLGVSKRLVCYVHFLGHDFQFIRKYFKWLNVFATKPRNPIKCLCDLGIEFRDSLILSGYSLAKTGENLHTYKIEKLVGELDYSLLRHPDTPLTNQEWQYIINDGLVVSAYIQEQIEALKSINRIPLTKTGFVRKYLRQSCYFTRSTHVRDVKKKFARYRKLMLSMQIGSVEEYLLLHQCYTGAIVHANCFKCNTIVEHAFGKDLTSSYPTQMVLSNRFPMSSGVKVKIKSKEEFDHYVSKYFCVIDAEIIDIRKSNTFESIISVSKCVEKEDVEEDNGRLIKAKRIRIVFNDIDLEIFRKFYKWKSMKIHRMYVYKRGRLPTDFVKAVLELYQKKTVLKQVEGKEREFQRSKEDINSCYGACVTDVCRSDNEYNVETGTWSIKENDYWKQIEAYNRTKNRFNFYPWGVAVTSLSRRALASAIYNLGDDYLYSDTDSVKYINPEQHEAYFDEYNRYIDRQIEKASIYHNIPIEMFKPKTQEGITKVIGYWDDDVPKGATEFKRFKTLGAKRYAYEYEKDGKICHSLTIAGVNKKTAIPYVEEHEKDFFDCMSFGYIFNDQACGKNLHTYIDDERSGYMVDYLGNGCEFSAKSGVHMESTTYEMTASDDYTRLLDGIFEIMLGY